MSHAKKFSVKERLRYRFDNSITKGQSAFIFWLAVSGLIASTFLGTLRFLVDGAAEGESIFVSAKNAIFGTSNTVVFDGKIPDGTVTHRFVFILIWMASVAVSATIIGFITNRIRERADSLRSGKSAILESGHTLILGWSNRAFPILKQLAIAQENERKPVIAIFANENSVEISDQIQSRVGDMGKTKVVIRKGDPTNPRDLRRTNIEAASSVIILDKDTSNDAAIISTILSIKAADSEGTIPVIAEIDEKAHSEALSEATAGRVLSVQSNQLIARVTAQASRQPGLAAVVLDLLDFEGDEIYFHHAKELLGKKYADALTCFNNASIIGIRQANGEILINPEASRMFKAGDQVIAIASDDDAITFTGMSEAKPSAPLSVKPSRKKAEHLLVIGWSEMGNAVMNELVQFLPAKSTIHIVANPDLVDVSELPRKKFGKIPVTFAPHRGSISDLAQAGRLRKYDEVIILAYREGISVAEADAQTMLTMLLMNKLFAEEGNGVEPTRLVAEILDSRQAELARVANADDLVVSDNLAALMIAQISQNAQLAPVFEDIFDAEGASISVIPMENYAKLGQKVSFASLVKSAALRGESAIGYRSAAIAKTDPARGVYLNPDKTSEITPLVGDGLIVLGDLQK